MMAWGPPIRMSFPVWVTSIERYWVNSRERRSLSVCLVKNVNKSFRATLVLDDYDKVNKRFALEETLGKPYALCAMLCAHKLRQWAKNKRAEKTLLYYFEDGDKDKGTFDKWHAREYGDPARFLSKQKAVGFQAGDFAGWKMRSAVEGSIKANHTLEKGIQLLRSVSMLKKIPKDAGVMTESVLLKFCQRYKVPAR